MFELIYFFIKFFCSSAEKLGSKVTDLRKFLALVFDVYSSILYLFADKEFDFFSLIYVDSSKLCALIVISPKPMML